MTFPLPTPTTALEAVNRLLWSIGESSISTLEGPLPRDAERARSYLHNASRALQLVGWSWNTDFDYSLSPAPDGTIAVPSDALKMIFAGSPNIVARGPRLYDNVAHTVAFSAPVTATIIRFLPFDYLPEAARHYITTMAGLEFQNQTLAEDSLFRFSEEMVGQARTALDEAEIEADQPNALTDNDTARAVVRR